MELNNSTFILKNFWEVIFIRTNRGPRIKELVNDNIPNGQFLIIGEDGEKLGVFNREKALNLAEEHGLDIFVVSPGSDPMVARLMDYAKHRYDQQKKAREMKKNQNVTKVKEVRLSPTIDKHDLDTKINTARRILSKGDKVKVSIRFRGRMITHVDIGREVMKNFIAELGDEIIVDSHPKLEGYQLIAVIGPAKNI